MVTVLVYGVPCSGRFAMPRPCLLVVCRVGLRWQGSDSCCAALPQGTCLTVGQVWVRVDDGCVVHPNSFPGRFVRL